MWQTWFQSPLHHSKAMPQFVPRLTSSLASFSCRVMAACLGFTEHLSVSALRLLKAGDAWDNCGNPWHSHIWTHPCSNPSHRDPEPTTNFSLSQADNPEEQFLRRCQEKVLASPHCPKWWPIQENPPCLSFSSFHSCPLRTWAKINYLYTSHCLTSSASSGNSG